METINSANRPILKTKKFSTLHINIFEQILLGKTNREISRMFGYTQRSHAVVDHSRKVMYKLLAMESLSRMEHREHIVFPRRYQFWWKKLLLSHRHDLMQKAVQAEFYPHAENLVN